MTPGPERVANTFSVNLTEQAEISKRKIRESAEIIDKAIKDLPQVFQEARFAGLTYEPSPSIDTRYVHPLVQISLDREKFLVALGGQNFSTLARVTVGENNDKAYINWEDPATSSLIAYSIKKLPKMAGSNIFTLDDRSPKAIIFTQTGLFDSDLGTIALLEESLALPLGDSSSILTYLFSITTKLALLKGLENAAGATYEEVFPQEQE